jgi:phenylacetate-CoA ligase
MGFYVEKLNRFKPEFLDGYPSAFYILAQYILANKIALKFTPVAISTTAETLFDHQREVIEKAFDCKVYNQYASSEGAPWIVECKEGHYHLWTDTGIFEFIDQKENSDDTVISEMIVTSFRNLKTPLIRYRIGDYVVRYKEEKVCPCGSHYPMIYSIVGREDDILYTREKGYVGRLDPAYKGLSGIKYSKIVQTVVDRVEVLIVPDGSYENIVGDKLLKNLHERLGRDVSIELKIVENIPLGKNGKFKSVERQFEIEEEKV